jgi:cephalosporin-C deacetylase
MPLLFDMPWEQLQTYRGCNPKPKDFDAFWDRSLKEMEAIEPELELVPSPFQAPFAECFDMYFTGVGGARIHAKLLRPKNAPEPHPALLQFHGYTGNAGDWFDKLGYVAAGFTVAALDCRGQGGQSEDVGGVKGTTMRGQIIRGLDGPPEKLLFREIYLDTAQMARLVMAMPEVDPKRVGATGGSQGGGLTLACAALTPEIRIAAPVFPFLTDYKRFWQMDLTTDAYMEIKTYFRQFDPLHEREEEIFTKLGYIDVQFLAPRIRAKVFMVTSLMDTVCPPSSQFAAYNKITSEKSLCVYPDFGHEFLPGVNDRIFEFMMGL